MSPSPSDSTDDPQNPDPAPRRCARRRWWRSRTPAEAERDRMRAREAARREQLSTDQREEWERLHLRALLLSALHHRMW